MKKSFEIKNFRFTLWRIAHLQWVLRKKSKKFPHKLFYTNNLKFLIFGYAADVTYFSSYPKAVAQKQLSTIFLVGLNLFLSKTSKIIYLCTAMLKVGV